jgi:hypothetical protein
MSARSCATLANQGRDVAAADDSVSLCQVRENDYKAVNRPVHERARKSAISHWHGESQPSIAPLVRLVHSFDTFCSKVATNVQTQRLFFYLLTPQKRR